MTNTLILYDLFKQSEKPYAYIDIFCFRTVTHRR